MCSFSLSFPEASNEQTMQTNLTTLTEKICLPIKLSQKFDSVLFSKSSSSSDLLLLSMMKLLLLLLVRMSEMLLPLLLLLILRMLSVLSLLLLLLSLLLLLLLLGFLKQNANCFRQQLRFEKCVSWQPKYPLKTTQKLKWYFFFIQKDQLIKNLS